MSATDSDLLTIPSDIGQIIINSGAVFACPLLGTDGFIRFSKDRNLSIDRDRLFRFERLGLFSPVFRVLTPEEDAEPFLIPPMRGNNWFECGWAWDTTSIGMSRRVPDYKDRTQEAYYSIFQIDYLRMVLSGMNLSVELDSYIESSLTEEINWERSGKRWFQYSKEVADSIRTHEYRRAVAFLCQYISNRYYPHTQGDKRKIQVSQGTYSDSWISVHGLGWDWNEYVRNWKPREVERLFSLTPVKLRSAYEGLAISQAHVDPLESWYQLIQFVSLSERKRLKGDALCAETIRSSANMLRLFYRDLYGDELPNPNEIARKVIRPIPELETRKDTRRYLELVVNRFGLNPQPTVSIIVEGLSEKQTIISAFEKYFGTHPGQYGIEIIVLGGVDAATGNKEDRFRAIVRLIDYLHHHQTFTFLILDNERYARKLKAGVKEAKSIHSRRFVTRPEYVRVWKRSFEFDNFSSIEISTALTGMTAGKKRFSHKEIDSCRQDENPGAKLKELFHQKTGQKLDKLKVCMLLTEAMLSPKSRRKLANRPIIKTLERVASLASHNPFPVMQESWERNQESNFFGKKR